MPGLKATPDLFGLLGVSPALGRVFHGPEDERQVVLGHSLWQRRFGGDARIVGQSLVLDGQSYAVAGVMPPGSASPRSGRPGRRCGCRSSSAPSTPRTTSGSCVSSAACVPGRRREGTGRDGRDRGASPPRGHSRTRRSGQRRGAPGARREPGTPGAPRAGRCGRPRSPHRVRERHEPAAGPGPRPREGGGDPGRPRASRARLVRQGLFESVALSLAGGVSGLALARLGVSTLAGLGTVSLPRIDEIAVDGRVAAFSLALSLVTGIVSGLVPALRSSRPALVPSLKQGGRLASGRGTSPTARHLVVGEFALAVVLLVGAGLLVEELPPAAAAGHGLPVRGPV